jgi:muconolactone delta-isomerase
MKIVSFCESEDEKQEHTNMQYLVRMKIVPPDRPMSAEEGTVFFEKFIQPILELCKKLEDEKKILAGGPISGTTGLALVVKADSAKELDEVVASLPVWPRIETAITAVTTTEDRALSIQRRLSDSRGERSAQ